MVIFGDVLEHFFRSEAMDYIDYFLYRSDWVLALWPTFMPQDDAMDNAYEIHKSNFNLIDLSTKFDIHHYEKKFAWYNNNDAHYQHAEYNYCLMKGSVTIRHFGA
jgi:N-acetyl-gamma-glutamylphosphate reductase